jgi:hypothetical protein
MVQSSGGVEVQREPLPVTLIILGLVGVSLFLGLRPDLLVTPLESVVQGMALISRAP